MSSEGGSLGGSRFSCLMTKSLTSSRLMMEMSARLLFSEGFSDSAGQVKVNFLVNMGNGIKQKIIWWIILIHIPSHETMSTFKYEPLIENINICTHGVIIFRLKIFILTTLSNDLIGQTMAEPDWTKTQRKVKVYLWPKNMFWYVKEIHFSNLLHQHSEKKFSYE